MMDGSGNSVRHVPDRLKTPEMCKHAVKENGLNLQYVPEELRTPEICLQAVLSNPEAKQYVPKKVAGEYNVYEFYRDKLMKEYFDVRQLSCEQVQKVFDGEAVPVTGMRFAKNVILRDFTLSLDKVTNQITVKVMDEAPQNRQGQNSEHRQNKRKGMKM
jgi:hypothetical protein